MPQVVDDIGYHTGRNLTLGTHIGQVGRQGLDSRDQLCHCQPARLAGNTTLYELIYHPLDFLGEKSSGIESTKSQHTGGRMRIAQHFLQVLHLIRLTLVELQILLGVVHFFAQVFFNPTQCNKVKILCHSSFH